MADSIRNVVIRIKTESVPSKIKAPDRTAEKREAVSVRKVVEQAEKAKQTAFEESRQAIVEQVKAQKQVAKVTTESQAKIREAALKSGDAMKQAGEGIFTLARGAAFTFASTEEDAQKALKAVAALQGGFDIFKGTVETVRGVSEAMKAFSTISSVAATAETARAAATATATTATVAATPAAAALSVALGPITIIAVALAAAIGGLALAWKFFSDDAPEAVDETADSLKKASAEAQRFKETVRGISLAAEIDTIQFDAKESNVGLLSDPKARLKEIKRLEEQTNAEIKEARFKDTIAGFEGIDPFATTKQNQELELENNKRLIELEERRKRLQVARGDAEKQLADAQRDGLRIQQDALRTTKEIVEVRKQEKESQRIALGRLTTAEAEELKSLTDKARAGNLNTVAGVNRLTELGGESTQGFADQFFGNRGDQFKKRFGIDFSGLEGQSRAGDGAFGDVAGAQKIFDAAGGEKRLDAIKTELRDLDKLLAAGQKEQISLLKQINTSVANHNTRIRELEDAKDLDLQ